METNNGSTEEQLVKSLIVSAADNIAKIDRFNKNTLI